MWQHQVIPVIHHLNAETSLAQADLAFKAEADGVFLISHYGRDVLLFDPARAIKHRYPDKQIGLNLLGSSAASAFHQATEAGLDMVWADAPGVTSRGVTEEAARISTELLASGCESLLFFGSVAFKYQPREADPPNAALAAARLGMVPTTSGSATGVAPQREKLALMRQAIGARVPLAIASGMTPENVAMFLPYVTHFLVATGVSRDIHHFDETRLAAFVRQVHAG